jgi:hypothetical protein
MSTRFYDEILKPCLDQLRSDPGPDYGNLGRPTSSPVDLDGLEGDVIELFDDGVGVQRPGVEELNEAEAAVYRDAAEMGGLDVFAFYKSFRFREARPFPGKWGIFLLNRGVAALTRQLEDAAADPMYGEPPRAEIYELATDLLIRHEEYHFWVDMWALQQEMLPLGDPKKRYERYLVEKSMPSLFDDDIEESLANHYAYEGLRGRRFSTGRSAAVAIHDVLACGPGPYADFKFKSDVRQQHESNLAVAVSNGRAVTPSYVAYNLVHGGRPSVVIGETLRPPRRDNPLVGARNCPRHVVWSSGYSALLAPFLAPSRKEARAFMTEYLAGVSEGITDHEFFKIDNGEKVKFPNPHQNDLKLGEFKNILFKAGMYPVEFRRERTATRSWSKNCPRSPVKAPRSE